MVPNGWQIKTVGQLFEVQLGKMLNKAAKEKFPQYPYLGNSDVRWGYFKLSELKSMYFSQREEEKFTLEDGDILMCEGGEVGRCAIWNSGNTQVYYQKALHRLRGKGDIEPEYFQAYMSFINGTKLLDDFTTKTSIAHLTREKLVEVPVKTPPLPEQRKIAKILLTWDKAIITTEKLIETSKQQKKALMQQLLTGKKRLRSSPTDEAETGKAFEGEWKEVKVSSLITKHSEKTETNKQYPVLTSSRKGIYFQSDYYNDRDVASEDTTGYNVVPRGYFTYRHMSDDIVFKFNRNTICDRGIVSTLYPVFSAKEEAVVPYLLQVILNEGSAFKRFSLSQKQGGSRTYMYLSKLNELKIQIPSLREQEKIASVLTVADKEIEVLETKLAHFKQEKKALMQQLLTGKRRVKVAQEKDLIC